LFILVFVSFFVTVCGFALLYVTQRKIKGPENPTSQLLPIISNKCCSGDGEGRKNKGGDGGKMVCDKVVCVKDAV